MQKQDTTILDLNSPPVIFISGTNPHHVKLPQMSCENLSFKIANKSSCQITVSDFYETNFITLLEDECIHFLFQNNNWIATKISLPFNLMFVNPYGKDNNDGLTIQTPKPTLSEQSLNNPTIICYSQDVLKKLCKIHPDEEEVDVKNFKRKKF